MQFRAICGAGLLALVCSTSAQAADPLEKCGKAFITGTVSFSILEDYKEALLAGCKGKSPSEVGAKLDAKINKLIEKGDKVDGKLDCGTNADVDIQAGFPLPGPIPAGTMATLVTAGETFYNGIND